MRTVGVFAMAALLSLLLSASPVQDPVKVDSQHYQIVLENNQVRVLRITYAPGDKSVMHDHPAGVAVFLTDQVVKFTYPDGKSETVRGKAGDATWIAAGKHLPENTNTKPLELILVELKK